MGEGGLLFLGEFVAFLNATNSRDCIFYMRYIMKDSFLLYVPNRYDLIVIYNTREQMVTAVCVYMCML